MASLLNEGSRFWRPRWNGKSKSARNADPLAPALAIPDCEYCFDADFMVHGGIGQPVVELVDRSPNQANSSGLDLIGPIVAEDSVLRGLVTAEVQLGGHWFVPGPLAGVASGVDKAWTVLWSGRPITISTDTYVGWGNSAVDRRHSVFLSGAARDIRCRKVDNTGVGITRDGGTQLDGGPRIYMMGTSGTVLSSQLSGTPEALSGAGAQDLGDTTTDVFCVGALVIGAVTATTQHRFRGILVYSRLLAAGELDVATAALANHMAVRTYQVP